jgi:hypothetical protein
VISRRRYITVLLDVGASIILLLETLGVLLGAGAHTALLLATIRVLLATPVLTAHLLGDMILLPLRWHEAMKMTLKDLCLLKF